MNNVGKTISVDKKVYKITGYIETETLIEYIIENPDGITNRVPSDFIETILDNQEDEQWLEKQRSEDIELVKLESAVETLNSAREEVKEILEPKYKDDIEYKRIFDEEIERINDFQERIDYIKKEINQQAKQIIEELNECFCEDCLCESEQALLREYTAAQAEKIAAMSIPILTRLRNTLDPNISVLITADGIEIYQSIYELPTKAIDK